MIKNILKILKVPFHSCHCIKLAPTCALRVLWCHLPELLRALAKQRVINGDLPEISVVEEAFIGAVISNSDLKFRDPGQSIEVRNCKGVDISNCSKRIPSSHPIKPTGSEPTLPGILSVMAGCN
jgi:hypothetical protein